MNRNGKQFRRDRQQGAVLVVGLIILMIMTLIGISSIHTAVIEEHINGNVRDHQLAFNAAETALREGEAFIESLVSLAVFDGTEGMYGPSDSEPDPAGDWTASDSRQVETQLEGIATAPRYRIKMIGEFGGSEGSLNIGRYGAMQPQPPSTGFYITARGTGGSNQSVVIVRSYYGRKVSQ
jgi:type IV pilus assembly protein PilX